MTPFSRLILSLAVALGLPTLIGASGLVGTLRLDRVLATGIDARTKGATWIQRMHEEAPQLSIEMPQAVAPSRFGLEQVIEDLSRTANVPTARFAVRRMEYRSPSTQLTGSSIAWRPLLGALGSLSLGMLMLVLLHTRRNNTSTSSMQRGRS